MVNRKALVLRDIKESDIGPLADYWFLAEASFLHNMGVDVAKMPSRGDFEAMLFSQISSSDSDKRSFALIAEFEGKAIGHCNLNPIEFGDKAAMHLHIWQTSFRQKGLGTEMVKKSLPVFFERFQLKLITCEPLAKNLGPIATLKAVGFQFDRNYYTIPDFINYPQVVSRWVLSREHFFSL